jgi:hypothetical protein
VLKDSPGTPRAFVSAIPPNDQSTADELVAQIEENLSVIREQLRVEELLQGVQSDLDESMSRSYPISASCDEDGRESAHLPSYPPTNKPQTRPDYEWWSPAWDALNGMLGFGGVVPLIPVCPSSFKDLCKELDVFMVDVVAHQSRTDPVTGDQVDSSTDLDLIPIVAGCACDRKYATMIKVGRKGGDQNELLLDLLALAAQLVPTGRSIQYDTSSQFLVEQWDTIMQWKMHGYQGFDCDACPPQWKKIMWSLEGRTARIGIFKSEEDSLIHEAIGGMHWRGSKGWKSTWRCRSTDIVDRKRHGSE